jgi:hypothetical protein
LFRISMSKFDASGSTAAITASGKCAANHTEVNPMFAPPFEDELRGRDRKRRAFAQEGLLKNVLIGRPRAQPDRATWCRHLGEPAVTEQPGIGAQGGQEPEAVTVPGKVGPVAFAYSAPG